MSNLFHGLEEKSPLKADVYLSMLTLAKETDLAQVVVTDLDQVRSPQKRSVGLLLLGKMKQKAILIMKKAKEKM